MLIFLTYPRNFIANSMLARCREYLPLNELKSLYHGIFSSHLNYACQIWGLSDNEYIDRIFKIQKNALRIITKSGFNAHTNPLLKELKILKLVDHTTLLNCLFLFMIILIKEYQNLLTTHL